MSYYKKLEEIAKSKGKELFIESFDIKCSPENIEIFKESKLVEAFSGKSEYCIGVLKNVPISRFTLNRNGRVYNEKLWRRIEKLKLGENTYCNCGHQSDEDADNPATIIGIWKNLRVNESFVLKDLYILEGGSGNGRLLLSAVMMGGNAGMSTVGFGELKEDGCTVDENTFDYQGTDWVKQPSQEVYATVENILESSNNQKSSQILTEVTTNKNNTDLSMEKKMSQITVETLSKLQEVNLKNQVRSLIKKANSIKESKDLKQMAEVQKEIKEMYEIMPMEDEKSKLMDADKDMECAMESGMAEMEKQNSDMSAQYEELQKKYAAASELSETLKTRYKKALEIIEKLGGSESNPQKLQMVEDMQDDIAKFLEDRKNMQADLDILIKEREVMLKDIKQFIEERKVMLSDINLMVEDIQARDSDIKQFVEDRGVMTEDIKQLLVDRTKMEEDIKDLSESKKLVEKSLEEMRGKLSENFGDAAYAPIETPVEGFPWETQDDMESISIDPAISNRMDGESTYRIESENKKPVLKEKVQPKKQKQAAASFTESFVNKNDLKMFYEKKLKQYPSIAKIEKKVMAAKSLLEAVNMIEAFVTDEVDHPVLNLKESSFTGKGGFTDSSRGTAFLDGYL